MKYSIFIFAVVSVFFGAVGAANADLFPEGLRFEIGAAYGYISPDDINNMLDDINEVYQELNMSLGLHIPSHYTETH